MPLAAHVEFRRAVVHGRDDAFETEPADDDAIADRRSRRARAGAGGPAAPARSR